MKKILYIALILSLMLTVKVFAQDGKIGFVDLAKAFDEYQKTKDFDKSLEQKGDVKQKQREEIVKDIRKMRDEIELLNETSRAKKEKDIESKVRDLQDFDLQAKNELSKERDDMVRDILKEMNDVIKEYGTGNGYSIILNDRVLLYGVETMDLTGKIIEILNARYQKR